MAAWMDAGELRIIHRRPVGALRHAQHLRFFVCGLLKDLREHRHFSDDCLESPLP
jgi:hypothetical protein